MSMLRNDVNPIFLGEKTVAKYDEKAGYVRLPLSVIENARKQWEKDLESPDLSSEDREEIKKALSRDANAPYDEADKSIKETYGKDHYYGQIGMPVLLADRLAAGVC